MRIKLFCVLTIVVFLFLSACGDHDDYSFSANAGPDQNVTTETLVSLDGSSSYNTAGATMTYSWSFDSLPGDSSATLSNQSAVNPTFTADVEGVYVLTLVVIERERSRTDSVTITAAMGNSAPVANAGADQNVSTTSTVTLDGSGSSDANLDTLTYAWELTSAPVDSTASLSDATAVKPTFVADKDGDYVLQLVVNDGIVDSAADVVTIMASSVNSAPVASTGADQNVITGATVTLDGSGSSDADLDTLTYAWNLSSAPADSTAVLSDTTAVKPTFVADKGGSYVVQLVVSDGALFSAVDSVTITAATANSKPVALAGGDQNVTTGDEVTLDGSGSSDADSDALTYTWSFTSAPADSTASLSDATAVKPTFVADKDGDYVLQLIVHDGTVGSAADTVTITAATGGSITHNGVIYNTVTSPYTGRIWLDRNLGASQVCTASNDAACYGDYYQWGRGTDGHQLASSATTTTRASDFENAGTDFILFTNDWTADNVDSLGVLRYASWDKTDGTSVCPTGYRVPSVTEILNETINSGVGNSADVFNDFLKLPAAGARAGNDGVLLSQGTTGLVWVNYTGGVSTTPILYFNANIAILSTSYIRVYGLSVRCIQN